MKKKKKKKKNLEKKKKNSGFITGLTLGKSPNSPPFVGELKGKSALLFSSPFYFLMCYFFFSWDESSGGSLRGGNISFNRQKKKR